MPVQPMPTVDEETAVRVAELFRALGDASRVRIIGALLTGEANVTSLAEIVGISESAISHHLRSLRQLRLVRFRRDGRHVFYMLDDDHVISLFKQGLDHVEHE